MSPLLEQAVAKALQLPEEEQDALGSIILLEIERISTRDISPEPDPEDWPFADPPDTEVITLERIVRLHSSILLVTHDEDDEESSWQFMDGDQVFEDDAVAVLLGEMVQFDPSLIELADLPRGWHARRSGPDQPWTRAEGEPSY